MTIGNASVEAMLGIANVEVDWLLGQITWFRRGYGPSWRLERAHHSPSLG